MLPAVLPGRSTTQQKELAMRTSRGLWVGIALATLLLVPLAPRSVPAQSGDNLYKRLGG